MLAILELFIFFILWPYILFGIILAKIWEAVCAVFNPVLLLVAVWFASIGVFLLPSSIPNDRQWVSLVESVAQAHIFWLKTPFALFALAGCVLVVSVFTRLRKSVSEAKRTPERGRFYR